MQKYSCEFELGVYCSYKTIVPVEDFNSIKDNRDYHIYSILATNKITIDKDSVILEKNGISLTLIKHKKDVEERFDIKASDILGVGLDYTKAEVTIEYPYSNLTINFQKEYLKEYYNENLKGRFKLNVGNFIQYKTSNIDAQSLFNLIDRSTTRDMEVLYIGQAYGSNGKRKAQDRLKVHETLQKILINFNSKHPDKRIYILLMQMTPQLFTGFNGISKEFMCTEEESYKHLERGMLSNIDGKQVINITEAAMINYFKPKYNTTFVNNFPSPQHKGYSQYYNLDYNCITVELDMELDNMPYIRLYTQSNSMDNPYQFIKYNLFNDPNRSNMNDIFVEREDDLKVAILKD